VARPDGRRVPAELRLEDLEDLDIAEPAAQGPQRGQLLEIDRDAHG
jgi:hypothetical protein